MADLPPEARELIESGQLAHLVTLNPDGSPQLTAVWVGIEDGEIVSGHMVPRRKLDNVRRDPRVVLSIESPTTNPIGLREYLVVHGTGRVTEGGAADLLQRLAHVYMGPDAEFPPASVRGEPGFILRIKPERLGGVGPWA
ncbi:MAG TPA: PPOX class F420-dependent oxidoreductase [Solirubrobacterales bacterium]|nr:PPOX class F420-dependent oxidoreductase [Solirubrobacterales bacterium]